MGTGCRRAGGSIDLELSMYPELNMWGSRCFALTAGEKMHVEGSDYFSS